LLEPRFAAERADFEKAVDEVRKENQENGQISAKTLSSIRAVIQRLKDKLTTMPLVDPAENQEALNFVKTVYTEGLGPSPKQALDPNMGSKVGTELLPGGKLAIALDGSWIYGNWQKTGAKPWPQWSEVLGQTAMPTQDGSGKGKVSLSGGWTWAIPAKSKNPDAAWNLIKTLQTQKNAAKYATEGAQIAVRKDVASDATYKSSSKSTQFFTDLVSVTVYRPAYAEYPKVSNEIITAMEAVMTGQSSIDKAAKNYDEAVEGIVGKDKTTSGQ